MTDLSMVMGLTFRYRSLYLLRADFDNVDIATCADIIATEAANDSVIVDYTAGA